MKPARRLRLVNAMPVSEPASSGPELATLMTPAERRELARQRKNAEFVARLVAAHPDKVGPEDVMARLKAAARQRAVARFELEQSMSPAERERQRQEQDRAVKRLQDIRDTLTVGQMVGVAREALGRIGSANGKVSPRISVIKALQDSHFLVLFDGDGIYVRVKDNWFNIFDPRKKQFLLDPPRKL
ncbi:MAG: hypothetical protein HY394_00690 [Candidatus Diapherotrites archaeon]|nr:hypothetical protein [Candidatus Diapherotrites archaeon]